jgi:hypothetical protein
VSGALDTPARRLLTIALLAASLTVAVIAFLANGADGSPPAPQQDQCSLPVAQRTTGWFCWSETPTKP